MYQEHVFFTFQYLVMDPFVDERIGAETPPYFSYQLGKCSLSAGCT